MSTIDSEDGFTKSNDAHRPVKAEFAVTYFRQYGIERGDAEYILSTLKGNHERNVVFPDHESTRDHILSFYDELGRG